MELEKLKAMAYDFMVVIQTYNQKLNEVNNQIAQKIAEDRLKESKEVKPEEPKVEEVKVEEVK